MLRPHVEYYAKYIRDALINGRKYSSEVSEQIDKVIVWIVGFGISGIALIISQPEKLANYSHDTLISIVIFLTASMVTGIFGRVIYSISSFLGISVMMRFETLLMATEFPYQPRKLVGNETAEQVLEYFKQDFDMDLPVISNMIQFIEPQHKEAHNASVRDYYERTVKWSDSQMENAKEIMDEVMKQSFGFTDKQLARYSRSSKVKPRIMMLAAWVSYTLYILSFIFFAIAIIIFSSVFIQSKI